MSWAIWLTGIPGSGKSSLARAAARAVEAEGVPVAVLELDVLRRTLTPAPRYSDRERDLVYGALVLVARLLVEHGVPVLIDATAHRRRWRDAARAVIPRFAEVHVQCPLAVAREREGRRHDGHAPRGIYGRAGRPGARVPGVDVPYEAPLAAEVTVDASRDETMAANVAAVVALARRLDAGGEARRAAPARREPVAIPDAESVRRTLRASADDEWERDLVDRARRCAAAALAGRGITVAR